MWTGTEMIIWGGRALLELEPGDDRTSDGYSYDEKTGKETPLVLEEYLDGAAYDPLADSWRSLPPAPIGEGMAQTAAWTGREMLVWVKGSNGQVLGAAYDPVADSWRAIRSHPYGAAYAYPTVWTGREMIIAVGVDYTGEKAPRGVTYDPSFDAWRVLPPSPIAPPDWSNAVWAGTEMVVWGGTGACEGCPPWSGGFALDPGSGRWRELPDAPIGQRANFQAAWAGRELIVWGGQAGPGTEADGAAFTTSTDRWRRLGPSPLDGRYWASAAWTGRAMVVWGGYDAYAGEGQGVFGDGAAYDPRADAWDEVSGAPLSPRCNHSAVWTGTLMVIWGGTEHCGSHGPRLADGAAFEYQT